MDCDPTWVEIYHNGWSTHEEHEWTTIWEDMQGQFWVLKTNHNVYTGSSNVMVAVSEMVAIREMLDAEERYSEG